jgi:DNA polymerase III alpha subunit
MVAEYRMLRFSADLHPLTLLKGILPDGTVSSDRLPHLRQHSTVRVAGLVTTRQRPGTAKGYIFVLMEDEHGPINVIVKPTIYKRDRNAVRMEPFLAVRGRLQKDGDTLNVIAYEVEALRVPGAPVRRRGMSKSHAAANSSEVGNGTGSGNGSGSEHDDLHTSLPGALESWAEPGQQGPSPFHYLTALRQNPPGIKSWG